jgi:hypothetical protein
MRHLPMKLGAAVLTASLFACFSQAGAMPGLSQNYSPNLTSSVEKAGYYDHHYGGYYGVRITGIGEATGTTGRMDITAGITTLPPLRLQLRY